MNQSNCYICKFSSCSLTRKSDLQKWKFMAWKYVASESLKKLTLHRHTILFSDSYSLHCSVCWNVLINAYLEEAKFLASKPIVNYLLECAYTWSSWHHIRSLHSGKDSFFDKALKIQIFVTLLISKSHIPVI